jgi:hypothetical protein
MNKTLTPDGLPANVIAALQDGEKITAIKLLREATGLSLKEAKDVVESGYIEPQYRVPEETKKLVKSPRVKPQRRAPIEVPKPDIPNWLLVFFVVAGFLVYYFLEAAD